MSLKTVCVCVSVTLSTSAFGQAQDPCGEPMLPPGCAPPDNPNKKVIYFRNFNLPGSTYWSSGPGRGRMVFLPFDGYVLDVSGASFIFSSWSLDSVCSPMEPTCFEDDSALLRSTQASWPRPLDNFLYVKLGAGDENDAVIQDFWGVDSRWTFLTQKLTTIVDQAVDLPSPLKGIWFDVEYLSFAKTPFR